MNPYEKLPSNAFWKLAVANQDILATHPLWTPKFHIQPTDAVVTFGSCFAQHIGRALKKRGFNWWNGEEAPHGMTAENKTRFNYNIFSARTGNIYTTSLLKQWTQWATEQAEIPDEVWEANGRYYDPFRPRVEPNGFASAAELNRSRLVTVKAFQRCIKNAAYFVFTLGLTESWQNKKRQYEYPMCPGTAAGTFNENEHHFENQQFETIRKNLSDAIAHMLKINPKLRFILTVSPVPLTATKSERHVLVATMASKSILRAVSDQLAANRPNVDYFPSYEIINSPVFKGAFFESNQRSVTAAGVDTVMDHFFYCQEQAFGPYPPPETPISPEAQEGEVCDEELLAAFGKA